MLCKIKESIKHYDFVLDWKEIGLLKTSMISLGTLVGMLVPSRDKKWVSIISGTVFVGTASYLMYKFFSSVIETEHEGCDCGCGDHDHYDIDYNEFYVD